MFRCHWPALALLVATLACTLLLWDSSRNAARREADAAFRGACMASTQRFENRLNRYASLLMLGRGLFYSSHEVEREEWSRFIASGQLDLFFPGVYGYAFVQRVPAPEAESFVAEMQRTGAEGFTISRHVDALTEDPNDHLYIIKYHEPAARNSLALGVDVASHEVNRNVYRDSMLCGGIRLSEPFRLHQNTSLGAAMVMALPVYEGLEEPRTPREREDRLFGWVALPFSMQQFLTSEGVTGPGGLTLTVRTGPDNTSIARVPSVSEGERGVSYAAAVAFGGRTFALEFHPDHSGAFVADTSYATLVLVGGCGVSVLLAGIVGATTRTRERAVRMAADMAASLRESEERALGLAKDAEAASLAKSQFLANMSHEIRTPMTAILGFAELIAREPSRDTIEEHVRTIRRNGEHLLTVINDVLDISKIEAGKLDVELRGTPLADLMEGVTDLMRSRAHAKGIDLRVEQPGPVPEVIHTDEVRFRQVLVNLVSNAVKFTEAGGVRLRVEHEAEGATGGILRVSVIDTGIGMDETQRSRLFLAFSQADTSITRRFGGTGLGLRISLSLAQMLGGGIDVESTPGRGSVFTLRVPAGDIADGQRLPAHTLERRTIASARGGGAVEVPPRLNGVCIAFAEDGPDNQRLVAHHLRRAGAEVRVFNNGLLALEAMTAGSGTEGPLVDPPVFDLVLTDMQMPELDGYTLARTLRGKGWTGPIVALTAHAMQGEERRCLEAGCSHYASKPIHRDVLLATCAEALCDARTRLDAA